MTVSCPHCCSVVSPADAVNGELTCVDCGGRFRVQNACLTETLSRSRQLGKFQLLDQVGMGAFGTVWRARDTELDRIVALKIPNATLTNSTDDLQRFYREARAAARLRHPGVVTVHEVALLDGLPAIVSDFIDGVTLKELLEARRLTFREAAILIADVAESLHYAHGMDLVHRDIKPANIMIELKSGQGVGMSLDPCESRAGRSSTMTRSSHSSVAVHPSDAFTRPVVPRALLLDFGLALRSDSEILMTLDGQVLGTPAYMSPEQAMGRAHHVDARSDVYSLGVILYELITGELPFRGSKMMLLQQVMRDEPRPPRQLNEKIPRDLETITLKCMAKLPASRYVTAQELADDLKRFLDGEPIRARPIRFWEQVYNRARRRPAVAALVVVSLSAVTILLSGSLWYNARLRAALQMADTEQERAEVNFQTALAAVDRMLTRVGERRLAEVPQMEEERRKLLEDALEFYRGFRRIEGNSRSVLRETGHAYQRTAQIYQMLGQNDQAEADLQQALTIQLELAKQDRQEPEHRHDAALSYIALGNLLRLTGRITDAEVAYAPALEYLQELVKTYPSRLSYSGSLATALDKLGATYRDSGRLARAEQMLREALELRERLARAQPEDIDCQQALADSYRNSGTFQQTAGRRSGAEAALQQAIEVRIRLVQRLPNRPDFQSELAKAYYQLAFLYDCNGQLSLVESTNREAQRWAEQVAREHPLIPAYQAELAMVYLQYSRVLHHSNRAFESASVHQRAWNLLEKLVQDYPQHSKFRLDLALNYLEFAQRSREAGELDESLTWYGRGIDMLSGVLKREPNHTDAKRDLSDLYMCRAESLVRLGREQEAREDWRQMVRLGAGENNIELRRGRAQALARLGEHAAAIAEVQAMVQGGFEPSNSEYNYACILSLSAQAARCDEQLPADARERLANQFALRALEHLNRARERGFFQSPSYIDYCAQDSDLQAVHSLEQFQAFLADLRQRSGEPDHDHR